MVSGEPAALRITAAGIDDAPAVRRLLRQTWHDTYDGLLGAGRVGKITARWHALPVLERQTADPQSAFLVARLGDAIVGHAFAGLEGGDIDLRRLYVAPAAQRRGIGRALVDAVTLRFPGAPRMVLAVARDNATGVAFYRRCGFAVVGAFTDDDSPHLRMTKPIPAQP